ncbi:MAG: nicotinamide mononucleotide transporter [Polaromonas sp.]
MIALSDLLIRLPEVVGTTAGILGALMLAIKSPFSAWAWPVWIVSNIAWIYYALALPTPAYGLIAQQVVFGIINFVGIWKWMRKPGAGTSLTGMAGAGQT